MAKRPSDHSISQKATKTREVKPSPNRDSRESRIPVGTQFSPGTVDLGPFLNALIKGSGDKKLLERLIWEPSVRIKDAGAKTKRRKSLPLEAARQYGLLDTDYRVTDLTKSLASLKKQKRYDEFAKHILLRLNGLRVVTAIREMHSEGLKVTGDTLAAYLTDQGFRVTIHNTAINSLRMWLACAGVFPRRGWTV